MLTTHARPVAPADIDWLAPRLRHEDVEEIRASSGQDPLTALREGLTVSDETWTIQAPGKDPCGIFGVAPHPLLTGCGLVWMLATPGLAQMAVPFVRQTPVYLERFHKRYPILGNFVDARNDLHIRWLQRIGFTFLSLHPQFGYEGRPFYEFAKLCVTPS